VNTLQRSLVTHVPLLMQSLIKGAANEVLRAGPQSRMVFCINTHPYELTDEEKAELCAAMEISVGDSAEYECVKVPLEFLTPENIKSQYSVLIMYEFADWMRMHAEAFREFRMRDVIIYAPTLLEKKPTDKEMKEMAEMQMDPFDSARIAAAPAFQLHFLTTDVFCMRDATRDAKMVQMYYSDPNKVDDILKQEELKEAQQNGSEQKSTLTKEEAAALFQELSVDQPESGDTNK
jgi:hypothetical protein